MMHRSIYLDIAEEAQDKLVRLEVEISAAREVHSEAMRRYGLEAFREKTGKDRYGFVDEPEIVINWTNGQERYLVTGMDMRGYWHHRMQPCLSGKKKLKSGKFSKVDECICPIHYLRDFSFWDVVSK